ncbi:trehalose-phosphatase [Fretibacter rubidus]|uniref:trehalose-phosphatase n=1 Tax=Fretibacter rubidus TaxID=570162 RepID=UPI00352B6D6A
MTSDAMSNFTFPKNTALFLDFDGTLVSFADDPNAVHLTSVQTDILLRLHAALSGAVALISGRDIRDLSKRTPQDLWRIGNHGLYAAAPGKAPPNNIIHFPPTLRQTLETELRALPKVWIEDKGPILAIHHRANPDAGPDIVRIATKVMQSAILDDQLCLQVGHDVVEIKPTAANKGKALLKHMSHPDFTGRIAVMIGDDTTDEDGFLAAQSLGGFGIKMGPGPTAAKYRIDSQDDLYTLLGTLI